MLVGSKSSSDWPCARVPAFTTDSLNFQFLSRAPPPTGSHPLSAPVRGVIHLRFLQSAISFLCWWMALHGQCCSSACLPGLAAAMWNRESLSPATHPPCLRSNLPCSYNSIRISSCPRLCIFFLHTQARTSSILKNQLDFGRPLFRVQLTTFVTNTHPYYSDLPVIFNNHQILPHQINQDACLIRHCCRQRFRCCFRRCHHRYRHG